MTLSKTIARLALARCSAFAFFFSCLWFARVADDVTLQTAQGVACRCLRYVAACQKSTTAGPSRRSCMPCKMSCIVFTAQLAFSFSGLLWLRPSRPLSQHGHRLQQLQVVLLLLPPSSDSDKALAQPRIGVIASNTRPGCLICSVACFRVY